MKRTLLFYITGHGYGHATRTLEVIQQLHHLKPDWGIVIESDVPEWLFQLNLGFPYHLVTKPCDVGAIQRNSYDVAPKRTLLALRTFLSNLPQRLLLEEQMLREFHIDGIVGDIPPLAFAVAGRANLPSIGISNFSWDWIYEPYVERFPEFLPELQQVKEAYSHCSLLLRLPFAAGMTAFSNIQDIPLIARRATLDRATVRSKLGITDDERLVLVALRQEELASVHLSAVEKQPNLSYLFFTPVPDRPDFRSIPPDFLPFQNLVAASDLVLSKPGYGIVSECLANGTPLLFLPRRNFREYPILKNALVQRRAGRPFPRRDFLSGNWQPSVEAALELSDSVARVPAQGAQKAAETLVSFLR